MCLRDAEGRLRPDLWVVLVVLHCMLSTALGPLIGFLSWAVVVVAPKPLPYSCSGTFGLALFGNSVVSDTDCSLSAPPSAYNYVWTGLVFCITPALLTRLFVTTTCCCLPRNYAALCAIATLCVCFVSELVAIGCASTYLPISIAPWQASLTNVMIIATMTAEPALSTSCALSLLVRRRRQFWEHSIFNRLGPQISYRPGPQKPAPRLPEAQEALLAQPVPVHYEAPLFVPQSC